MPPANGWRSFVVYILIFRKLIFISRSMPFNEQLQPISCLSKVIYMQKIVVADGKKIKSCIKSCASVVALYFFFVFSWAPFAFQTAQTRRTIEKTNIVSKFEAVYCTMLNIAHTNTYTSPPQRDALNGIVAHTRTELHLQRHDDDSKSNRNGCTHMQHAHAEAN